jgi:hypothetical protein
MLGDFYNGNHGEEATATLRWLWEVKGVACPSMGEGLSHKRYKYNSTQGHVRRSFNTRTLEEGCRVSQVGQGLNIDPWARFVVGPETGAVPNGLQVLTESGMTQRAQTAQKRRSADSAEAQTAQRRRGAEAQTAQRRRGAEAQTTQRRRGAADAEGAAGAASQRWRHGLAAWHRSNLFKKKKWCYVRCARLFCLNESATCYVAGGQRF